jgi:hypothetical protein
MLDSMPLLPVEHRASVAGLTPKRAVETIGCLRHLLLHSQRLPKAFSYFLQSWLSARGLTWPKETFVHDYSHLGSGRRRTGLGAQAAELYDPGKFGFRRVARKLLPEEFKKDSKKTTDKVRRAWERHREPTFPLLMLYLSQDPAHRSLLRERLAFCRLKEEADRLKRELGWPEEEAYISLSERMLRDEGRPGTPAGTPTKKRRIPS